MPTSTSLSGTFPWPGSMSSIIMYLLRNMIDLMAHNENQLDISQNINIWMTPSYKILPYSWWRNNSVYLF